MADQELIFGLSKNIAITSIVKQLLSGSGRREHQQTEIRVLRQDTLQHRRSIIHDELAPLRHTHLWRQTLPRGAPSDTHAFLGLILVPVGHGLYAHRQQHS